ncbi:MAG: rhomboid family intramembrane serine protease [Ignavibacteriae bacterium]|nr:MAG: rhomboid family intramembrane serine protease [Ignavibacteriota bacterium]
MKHSEITDRNTPIVNFPVITYSIITTIILIGIILTIISVKGYSLNNSVLALSLVPAHFKLHSLFTSIILIPNLPELPVVLLVFFLVGRKTEDVIGRLEFLVIFIFGGLLYSAIVMLTDYYSTLPYTSGSGAIAIIVGVYYALYPKNKFLLRVTSGGAIESKYFKTTFLVIFWFLIESLTYYISIESEGVKIKFSLLAVFTCCITGFIIGMVLKKRGVLDRYNEDNKDTLEEKSALREEKLNEYKEEEIESRKEYPSLSEEFVEKDHSDEEYLEKYCYTCTNYSPEEGICSELNENVKEYPGKFDKCGGKYFEKIDPLKNIAIH